MKKYLRIPLFALLYLLIGVASCSDIKDIIGVPSEMKTCIIQREGGKDTITGYNRLIYTPYRGGQFYFFLDTTLVHAPIPLNYVDYLEER